MKSGYAITVGSGKHPFLGAGNRTLVSPGENSRLTERLTADAGASEAARRFAALIPPAYAACIDWDNPDDPLLRQVMPSAEELEEWPGYETDPLRESSSSPYPGLLRKYRDRVLLTVTAACSIHCRFCFRRHVPRSDPPNAARSWEGALAWIARQPEIRELILSGGEPLLLPDAELEELVQQASQIPHLRRLRIHTRTVVAMPERVSAGLIQVLDATRLTPIVVVHINHPAELGEAAREAIARLQAAGIPILQQGVLLRGVNDSVEVLEELVESLVGLGVIPYYLHLLDAVAGAAHFAVPESEGRALIAALRERVAGYAVPRLARERPGARAKEVLAG